MSLIDSFVDWAHQGLLQSDDAQEYLRGRGISTDQWTRHRLGYVIGDFEPETEKDLAHNPHVCSDKDQIGQWCDSCRYKRWSSKWETREEGLPKVQLVGRRIIGGVVFPLTSYSGMPVGFQIRSLVEKHDDGSPANRYDSFLVNRRPEGYFFGIAASVNAIWNSKEAWLVEGPGDQLLLERLVAPNVVGITTSSPSMAQIRFLKRFVRRIVLCLDMDAAGRKGVRDFYKHHGEFFDSIVDVKYPCLGPKDKDPGDYWKKVGDVPFTRRFRDAA